MAQTLAEQEEKTANVVFDMLSKVTGCDTDDIFDNKGELMSAIFDKGYLRDAVADILIKHNVSFSGIHACDVDYAFYIAKDTRKNLSPDYQRRFQPTPSTHDDNNGRKRCQ